MQHFGHVSTAMYPESTTTVTVRPGEQ